MEEETVIIDMNSRVDGWKKGVQDGEAHARKNLLRPNTVKLKELASSNIPQSANAKQQNEWITGYRSGFREGLKRGQES